MSSNYPRVKHRETGRRRAVMKPARSGGLFFWVWNPTGLKRWRHWRSGRGLWRIFVPEGGEGLPHLHRCSPRCHFRLPGGAVPPQSLCNFWKHPWKKKAPTQEQRMCFFTSQVIRFHLLLTEPAFGFCLSQFGSDREAPVWVVNRLTSFPFYRMTRPI